MDQFYDDIVKELTADVSRDVYYHLLQKGYKGKHTAAYDYMNKIIKRDHIDIAFYKSRPQRQFKNGRNCKNMTIFREQEFSGFFR